MLKLFKTKKCANCRQTLGPKCPHFCAPYPRPNRRRSPKKAVIVGISYHNNPKHEINGGSVYAGLMRLLLINHFNFPDDDSSIKMLTEREGNILPTKQNIIWAMDWLVEGCQSQDSLVFYYFGHGSQQRNIKGEEKDGYDETLWPLDFENGVIVDDEINETLVKPLPDGVRLHAFVDASHSGTVLDLPFFCRRSRLSRKYKWEDHRPKTGARKGSSGGEVICFSGCDDGEAYNNNSSSKMRCVGAMTICFINAIEKGHGNTYTYGSILRSMRKAIRNDDSDAGLTVEQIAVIATLIASTVELMTQITTLIVGINDCGILGRILGAILGSTSTAVIEGSMEMLRGIRRQIPITLLIATMLVLFHDFVPVNAPYNVQNNNKYD